jgi:hypothetical protein
MTMYSPKGSMAEVKHTMFAGMAFGLAELFKHSVGKMRLKGDVTYSVELSAPEGESTAGGKQALQHVKLVPDGGGPTLVIGTANAVEKLAEMRTYKHVDELHRQRFKGAPFDVQMGEYETVVEAARKFFTDYKYTVTVVDAPARAVAAAAPSRPMPAVSSRPVAAAGVAKLPTSRLRVILTVCVTAAVVVVVAIFLRH